MQDKRIYTINSNKLDMAYFEGFTKNGDSLASAPDTNGGNHFVIFNRFCSYESGTKWGRFFVNADLEENNTLRIMALASDGDMEKACNLNEYFHKPDIVWDEKRQYFIQDGVVFTNKDDVLLYDVAGQYLWIAIEITGDGHDRLSGMKLDSRGDNFMQTFPEIYQEEGGFFHRYMSIFSSIYQDMSDKLYGMDRYLDIDTAPYPVLSEIARWLGIDTTQDFLEETIMRKLIKNICGLNRIKGTKKVMEEIVSLILGKQAVIMERNKMENHIPSEYRDIYKRLYGDTIYDVVILVRHNGDEKVQAQMMFILDRFKPVRSRIRLVFAENNAHFDSYCYMDFNASLDRKGDAAINGSQKMNGTVMIQ